MSNDQKRRGNERYENLPRKEPIVMARFKVRSGETQEMWDDDWNPVFLMNLSAGGILFYYTKDLAIGTLLDLKIYVPNSVRITNYVGKVIRIDKPKSTSVFTIAIKFIDIGEQEKERINTSVEEDAFNNHSKQYSPRFGEIAVDMGFVTEKQLKEALAEQAEDNFSNKPHRFIGSILFENGWITKKGLDITLYELYKLFEEGEFIKLKSHSP